MPFSTEKLSQEPYTHLPSLLSKDTSSSHSMRTSKKKRKTVIRRPHKMHKKEEMGERIIPSVANKSLSHPTRKSNVPLLKTLYLVLLASSVLFVSTYASSRPFGLKTKKTGHDLNMNRMELIEKNQHSAERTVRGLLDSTGEV